MVRMTQACEFGNAELARLTEQLDELKGYVKGGVEGALPAHEMERGIWERVLRLGREALGLYFSLQGPGDRGECLSLSDGREVRRLAGRYTRQYRSIFGGFTLSRVAYGSRAGQKLEWVPLDARLQLPQSVYSYVLQDWDERLSVENPYGQVNRLLSKMLGFEQPLDSIERMGIEAAETVPAYRKAKRRPQPSEEGAYLVISADGKGIPICRAVGEPAIVGHARSRGPKPDRKKMAIVGSIYTVDAVPRSAEEVVESLFRLPHARSEGTRTPRAKPLHKQVRAALTREHGGVVVNATEEIIGWLAAQAQQRTPKGDQKTVVIMDGQLSLWEAIDRHFPSEDRIEILDLLHVTPRLWEAAHLFHPGGSEAGLEFVRDRVLRILQGEAGTVIGGLRQMGTKARFKGARAERLEKICRYLKKNQSRMRYDLYLAAGYPIASGVIEGACRHFVKDRMERAGMRWTVDRAQAMLDLRSTYLNGDWDEFTAFRIKRETERLYPHRDRLDTTPWAMAA